MWCELFCVFVVACLARAWHAGVYNGRLFSWTLLFSVGSVYTAACVAVWACYVPWSAGGGDASTWHMQEVQWSADQLAVVARLREVATAVVGVGSLLSSAYHRRWCAKKIAQTVSPLCPSRRQNPRRPPAKQLTTLSVCNGASPQCRRSIVLLTWPKQAVSDPAERRRTEGAVPSTPRRVALWASSVTATRKLKCRQIFYASRLASFSMMGRVAASQQL